MSSIDIDEIKRRALFVPCDTKEALHTWIKVYLELDIPDTIVDPASTSCPMDIVWEVYDAAIKNNRVDFARVLSYAARDSFKTLGAAVLEVLAIVHLRRNVAHMAAIEFQAKKAQGYVKKFFSKPFLREFVVGDNDRKKEIARYYNPRTGQNLNQKQFQELDISARSEYQEITNYIQIVICTPSGANSEHVPFFVVDEVDLANAVAYEEAKMIPAPMGDLMPITLLTSTRKYSFGLVQSEIDKANETGLHIRHWNIIDVTRRCDKKRHRPDLPIVDAFYSDNTLKTLSKEEYDNLTPDEKDKYTADKAYSGCLTNCKMFAMCRGRLATKQKESDPKAKVKSLLKPVEHTQNQFKAVDVEVAKAQLLCRKPSTTGLVYPNFDRETHMLSAAQIAKLLTGEEHQQTMTKQQLIAFLVDRGARFYGGMDFGYTHNFVVVVGAVLGNRCFILECVSQAEIELSQQIELCDAKVRSYSPAIFADPENPQAVKTFKTHGYTMKTWTKGKGSVLAGIEILRMKLMPTIGDPQLFLLKGDPGCEFLAKRFGSYHWKLDAAGEPTDIPDDTDDDEMDATRYLIMNVFSKTHKVAAALDDVPQIANVPAPVQQQQTQQQWFNQMIGQHIETKEVSGSESTRKGKKGGIIWNID